MAVQAVGELAELAAGALGQPGVQLCGLQFVVGVPVLAQAVGGSTDSFLQQELEPVP